jgi:NADH dehydrogenase
VGGQPFQVQYVPVEALQAQHAAATDAMQKTFAALMIGYAAGKVIETGQAQESFGLPLGSVQEYARQVLGKA